MDCLFFVGNKWILAVDGHKPTPVCPKCCRSWLRRKKMTSNGSRRIFFRNLRTLRKTSQIVKNVKNDIKQRESHWCCQGVSHQQMGFVGKVNVFKPIQLDQLPLPTTCGPHVHWYIYIYIYIQGSKDRRVGRNTLPQWAIDSRRCGICPHLLGTALWDPRGLHCAASSKPNGKNQYHGHT